MKTLKLTMVTLVTCFFAGCGVDDTARSADPQAPAEQVSVDQQDLSRRCPSYAPRCCGVLRNGLCSGQCVATGRPCP